MKVVDNVMIFETDDEINDFCISTSPRISEDKKLNVRYYTYDLTDKYYDAINKGCYFTVTDPSSRVMKNGLLYRGLITIPIKGLVMKKEI